MKYAVIIPDGAPDRPVKALGGKTPLEAAALPALDALAERARLGTTYTGANVKYPSEAGAYLSVLGYDPDRYAAGEGALTARIRGVAAGSRDQVFCCSLVTVIDEVLRDPTAGLIRAAEATALVGALDQAFGEKGFHFHACGGLRNLCVWGDAGELHGLRTTPAHWMVDEPLDRHLPRGRAARPLRELMQQAEALLAGHDINKVRRDLDENTASGIWLWGEGPIPSLPAFEERYRVRGAMVSDCDVMRSIGQLIGWSLLDTANAAAGPDADYGANGEAAVAALDSHDLVCVHVHTPQVLTVVRNVKGKTAALEAIDRHIVAPLLSRLQNEPEWRILVIAALPGGAAAHADLEGRSILAMAGSGIDSHRGSAFDEMNAFDGELHPERACDLMEYFLHR